MMNSKCKICGSRDWRTYLRFKGKNKEVVVCKDCRAFRTLPFLETDYSEREFYCEHYLENKELFRGFARDLVKVVRSYKEKGNLLDIGCAVGFLLEESRKNGFEAQGIELNKKAAKIAHSKGFSVESREIKDTDYIEKSFDVVTLNHILEHVVDPNTFLQEVKRVLKKDGILVIVVPNHSSLAARLCRQRWYGWGVPEHVWHFDRNSLGFLLARNGFKIRGFIQNSQHYAFSKSLRKNTIAIAARIGNMMGSGDQLIVVAGRAT